MSDALWIDFLLGGLVLVLLVMFMLMARGVPGGSRYFMSLSRQAGYDPDRARIVYWAAKIVLALLLPFLLLELTSGAAGFAAAAAVATIGFTIPDVILLARRRVRRNRITRSLSFFIDLLVSLLQSGLALEDAFRRAGRRGFPEAHPLAQEIDRVSEELAAGKERGAAFRALAERTGVADFHAIAAAMELGGRLGAPVSETLAQQAELQREKRAERGRIRIDRAMIAALVPILLCGYPLFLVLVIFPAVIDLIDMARMVREYLL